MCHCVLSNESCLNARISVHHHSVLIGIYTRCTYLLSFPRVACYSFALHIGWFNSLAGIVKRRFASYVKSHLATSSGDGSKKDRDQPHYGHPMHPTSPYHFEKLRQVAPTSSSMPSSPHFGNRAHIDHYDKERMAAHSPRVLSNMDRRHRSPDPPPRLVVIDFVYQCDTF